MKIKQIIINGLYNDVNFTWQLLPKVNILSGINGSFKTTLLKVFNRLCNAQLLGDVCQVAQAEVSLTEDVKIRYKSFNDSLLKLKNTSVDDMLHRIAMDMKTDIEGVDDTTLAERRLAADIIEVSKKGKDFKLADFRKAVNVDFISTFDVKWLSDKTKGKSLLDSILDDLERDYAYYQSDLSNAIVDKIKSGNQISQIEAGQIYKYRNIFLDIVQKAFSQTGKTILDNKSRIEFQLRDGTLIHSDALSSGEKQFLIIMLTVLLEKGEEYILMMDEPEISMHYEWQSKLIENILKLNPNCQIILSTHSPALIMDGWEQSVTNIDKIKSYNG